MDNKPGKKYVYFWQVHPLLWPLFFLAVIVLMLKAFHAHPTPQTAPQTDNSTTTISN